MPHFVRCIEGHVFDAEVSPRCPTCGALVDIPAMARTTPAAPPAAGATPIATSPSSPTEPEEPTAQSPSLSSRFGRSLVRIIVIGSVAGVISGTVGYFWSSHKQQSTQQLAPVPKPAVAAAKLLPVNPEAPKPAPVVPALPSIQKVDLSSTIDSALATARMETLYQQRDYAQAAKIAHGLATQENAISLFILGALQTGVMGPENRSEARKQFTAAAKFGDVRSAIIAANMMGRGIGGRQDEEGAEALYLYAARNGNADGERELALLQPGTKRGMTVGEAYNNLVAGKDVENSWRLMNEMIAAHSPTAICLAGWLHGHGDSTPRDFNRALTLFKAGAAIANPSCLWGLAKIAATGIPQLPRDPVAATVLLHLAARVVGPKSSQGVDAEAAALESKMSEAERAKAEELYKSSIPVAAATQNPPPAAHP